MAIVFISPKEKQRIFFVGITVSVVLFLAIISLIVLLPEFLPQDSSVPVPTQISLDKPDIAVNLTIVDSEKVKNLEAFVRIKAEFKYLAKDRENKEITGTILAENREEARKILEADGSVVIMLEEINIGRSDPFISY